MNSWFLIVRNDRQHVVYYWLDSAFANICHIFDISFLEPWKRHGTIERGRVRGNLRRRRHRRTLKHSPFWKSPDYGHAMFSEQNMLDLINVRSEAMKPGSHDLTLCLAFEVLELITALAELKDSDEYRNGRRKTVTIDKN